MLIQKKVRDVMIPLANYSVVGPGSTLRDAVLTLKKSYCELEAGLCTEAGPRTVLVVDNTKKLVGILDFQTILKVLIPEVAGGLSAKLAALGISVAFAEADAHALDESKAHFHARVMKNAETKVEDIMLKVRGTIQAESDILEALKLLFRNKITIIPVYEKEQFVGVVRDADLFLAVSETLGD
ncbi:MAG: CBS domain-containing protein [Desulfobacteraceae bacterium]|jgi:CBS domain-containing protein